MVNLSNIASISQFTLNDTYQNASHLMELSKESSIEQSQGDWTFMMSVVIFGFIIFLTKSTIIKRELVWSERIAIASAMCLIFSVFMLIFGFDSSLRGIKLYGNLFWMAGVTRIITG